MLDTDRTLKGHAIIRLTLLGDGKEIEIWDIPTSLVDHVNLSGPQRIGDGNANVWQLSWKSGYGSGLGLASGCVVWLTDDGPVFWEGIWHVDEVQYAVEGSYEYTYISEISMINDVPCLRVKIYGIELDDEFEYSFIATARTKDNRLWFFVNESAFPQIGLLLKNKNLRQIHTQLRDMLPR